MFHTHTHTHTQRRRPWGSSSFKAFHRLRGQRFRNKEQDIGCVIVRLSTPPSEWHVFGLPLPLHPPPCAPQPVERRPRSTASTPTWRSSTASSSAAPRKTSISSTLWGTWSTAWTGEGPATARYRLIRWPIYLCFDSWSCQLNVVPFSF